MQPDGLQESETRRIAELLLSRVAFMGIIQIRNPDGSTEIAVRIDGTYAEGFGEGMDAYWAAELGLPVIGVPGSEVCVVPEDETSEILSQWLRGERSIYRKIGSGS